MANNYFSATRGDTIPCYELSARVYPERGGPVADHAKGQDVLARTQCRHLLLLVHGFNNTASDALGSYNALMGYVGTTLASLRDAPDAIVFFQWPGDAAVIGGTGFFDFLGYPIDITRARDTAKILAECFEALAATYSVARPLRISVIGHSLGCRVILEALSIVQGRGDPRLQLEVVSLMAAAVPAAFVDGNDSKCNLLPGGQLPSTLIKCYSSWDFVLWLAFPLGEAAGVAILSEFATYFRHPEAVGRHGGPAVLGKPDDSLRTSHGHGAYWKDHRVADFFVAKLRGLTFSTAGAKRELEHRPLTPKVSREKRTLAHRSTPGTKVA